MEIIILPSHKEVNKEITKRVTSVIKKKPDSVLGLATGRTMLGVYRSLVEAYKEKKIDFSATSTFNLDEYIGFPPDNPLTFHSYMQENLFNHININPKNIFIPPSMPDNIEKECQLYEEMIKKKGGIDLQLLGIGQEGHIGFNEPSSSLQARTRVKTLTEETLRDNFGSTKGPRFTLTMGIGTILEAREIILVALSEEKARPIADAVEGPVTASCPASALQFHPRAKIIIDEEAGSLLKRKDYYKWIWEHKSEVENFE
jgi:glucosamine-6-phosphate deaminase